MKRLFLALAAIIIVNSSSFIPNARAEFNLPDSGQTKCYQSYYPYSQISCADTGQDGAYSINPLSYTDNGVTVTDNNTGLEWQKCSVGQNSDATCSGTASTYTWYQASGSFHTAYNPSTLSVCGDLALEGHDDWRLPTTKELMGIVDYSVSAPGPTIAASLFPNTSAADYWTSTAYAGSSSIGWYVGFYYGYVYYTFKSTASPVRCVRSALPQAAAAALVDNGNGTVTDTVTRLTWQQGEPGTMTWFDALSYCEGLSLAGYTDWRLPNVKEIKSLTDDARYNPAIDTTFFPNVTPSYYWSSTSYALNPYYAWSPSFNTGRVVLDVKSQAGSNVRCVRGGLPLYTANGNAGIANATVSLGGSAAATAVSAADGTYSFTGLGNGSYTITPTLPGYTFAPASQTVTVSNNSLTVPAFTAARVNLPPQITLDGTFPGDTYTAPATIVLTATAADADGTVSKVAFYNGLTLLYTDTSAPYSYTWTGVPAGTYTVTAVATDNSGASATSTASTITVKSANIPPTVSLSAPATGASYTAPATITLKATAADTDGTISKVAFYNGATLLYTDTTAPYSYTWSGVTTGTYALTAVATDNSGATTTSAVVTITVKSVANIPPTVTLSAPATGAAYTAPATIPLAATAADADGTVSKVAFYNGATLLYTDTTAPYSYSWTGVSAGTYTLTAVATDNSGATTASSAVTVTVKLSANIPPTVTLTAPAKGATYTAPAKITLIAAASDADGAVRKIEFINGTTVLFASTTTPYTNSYTWSSVPAGTYTLTARVTDNSGAATTSSPVTVTVR